MRVAVIGAGFGGLGVAARLRAMGISDFVVLERAGSVGGTWRDNTYPGCACDVPSHLYSFSFAPNPAWPRVFSRQPEIRAYLDGVADDLDLRGHIRFGTEVQSAWWDGRRWQIDTTTGPVTADVLVSATGPLPEPNIPDLPGLDGFPGRVFHSGRWDHGCDLRGKRVAVVGTGASAIQFVPELQPEVGALTVFQRTPPWVLPRADRVTTALERAVHTRLPASRALRRGVLWAVRESQVTAFAKRPGLMRAVEVLARLNMRRAIRSAALRRDLTPEYRIGCKRILLSNDWYPALAKPNVTLVNAGLREVRASTLVAADGRETDADVIIFGTGFHATDMPIAHRIKGSDGATLAERWQDGMTALRGTAVDGFPNFLMIIGPNSNLGNNSMILIIESQLNYLADYLTRLDHLGVTALTPRPEAVARWDARIQRRLARSVWNTGGCASWYQDANGRNTTIWPGTTREFRAATRRVDLAEYDALP